MEIKKINDEEIEETVKRNVNKKELLHYKAGLLSELEIVNVKLALFNETVEPKSI